MRQIESWADVERGVSFMNPNMTVQNRVEGTITTSGTKYIEIASGVLRRMWIFLESTTDITAFLANDGGGAANILGDLVAGEWREVTEAYKYGTQHGVNDPANPRKTVQLFAGAGFPADQKFSVVAEYWPMDGDAHTFTQLVVEP
jgi:hypothetical protein